MSWSWKKLFALLAVFALIAAACGDDDDEGVETDTPTETPSDDGDAAYVPSGGEILLLQWQAPSLANSYLSAGSKDVLAASLVIEPLARVAPDGSLVPWLATEIPTVENGGIPEDLTSITWTLQEGLVWSDGTPVTSEDVVFSYDYCTTTATGCTSTGNFVGVTDVVAVDDLTVTVNFEGPTAYPYLPFVGQLAAIIQKAQFENCVGEAAITCSDENFAPVGTGPYMITELRPEDTVLYSYNPNYRGLANNTPFFDTVQIKGGGDAEAAARSVLEIGEADYAWNLQVAPEILAPMEAAGNGQLKVGFTSQVEHIHLNQTDPESGSDYMGGAGDRHPILYQNPELARALSLAIDRQELVDVGYGSAGIPTCNMWNVPGFDSPNTSECLTQDYATANQILDEIGYLDTDGDGVRETDDGLPLEFTYVTSVNAVRQSNQELIKSYWAEIGVDVEMLAEDASLFFDGTAETSIWRFPSDMEMFTNLPDNADPFAYMVSWSSEQIPESANGWGGSNFSRMVSPELDDALELLSQTLPTDPDYKDRVIRVNDIISAEFGATIPLIHRGSLIAISNEIQGQGDLNAWDSQYWNIHEWSRVAG